MNERIRELAGQALDQAVPETWSTLNCEQLGRFQEKFAELIVQECCNVLQTHDIRMDLLYGAYGYDQGSLHKKIKQHFGVE